MTNTTTTIIDDLTHEFETYMAIVRDVQDNLAYDIDRTTHELEASHMAFQESLDEVLLNSLQNSSREEQIKALRKYSELMATAEKELDWALAGLDWQDDMVGNWG